MSEKTIFSQYALIGDKLDLKKNVYLQIDQNGKILNISFEEINNEIKLSENEPSFLAIPGFINSHVHIGDNFGKLVLIEGELSHAPPSILFFVGAAVVIFAIIPLIFAKEKPKFEELVTH